MLARQHLIVQNFHQLIGNRLSHVDSHVTLRFIVSTNTGATVACQAARNEASTMEKAKGCPPRQSSRGRSVRRAQCVGW
eukprot:scaffold139991_cov35-Tisochrysis_lutea.AAC.4